MQKLNKKAVSIITAVVLVLFTMTCVTIGAENKKAVKKIKQTKKISSSGPSLRLTVMDLSKGDLPIVGLNGTAAAVLSEEHSASEDGLSVKINFNGRGWCGGPKVDRSWAKFTSFNFNAYNPQDKALTFSLVIKDKDSVSNKVGRATWIVIPFVLKPGMNDVSIDLTKAKPYEEERELDLSVIQGWHFSYKFFPEQKWEETSPDEITIFVSNIRVEG
ncbi:MAG: hypothetical protein A2252_00740 [Elusimicrobia bacterium RIFOXYA2_FULL_39_19]|nr:MAG: hypothetical protein A2252_00740 [Elusimicrobia bacterium RIFOXYA2_FULL_39_19]